MTITSLTILFKMISAHLLGDFFFQSDRMCQHKYSVASEKKYGYLIFHALIQGLLTYLFIGEWSYWVPVAIIIVTHFIIDWIKTYFEKDSLSIFIGDQIAHYIIIALIWRFGFSEYYFSKINIYETIPPEAMASLNLWMIITAYLAVLEPSSILIKKIMGKENWIPINQSVQGLPNAGKWIGYLERILILTFIFTSNIEGIGFLLAAKSIFRFGELNKTKELKVTEYVLIGTFMSFTFAIIIGSCIKVLMNTDFLISLLTGIWIY